MVEFAVFAKKIIILLVNLRSRSQSALQASIQRAVAIGNESPISTGLPVLKGSRTRYLLSGNTRMSRNEILLTHVVCLLP